MGKRGGLGGRFLQGLLVYMMAMMTSKQSIIPAIDVLFSWMALRAYALNEDTLVEASKDPRSQPVDFIAVARMGCLIERLSKPRITIYVRTLFVLRDIANLQKALQNRNIQYLEWKVSRSHRPDILFINLSTLQRAMIGPLSPQ